MLLFNSQTAGGVGPGGVAQQLVGQLKICLQGQNFCFKTKQKKGCGFKVALNYCGMFDTVFCILPLFPGQGRYHINQTLTTRRPAMPQSSPHFFFFKNADFFL